MSYLKYLLDSEALTEWECVFFNNLKDKDISDMSYKQKRIYKRCEYKMLAYDSNFQHLLERARQTCKAVKVPEKKVEKETAVRAEAKRINKAIEDRAASEAIKSEEKRVKRIAKKAKEGIPSSNPFRSIDGGNVKQLRKIKLGDGKVSERLRSAGIKE